MGELKNIGTKKNKQKKPSPKQGKNWLFMKIGVLVFCGAVAFFNPKLNPPMGCLSQILILIIDSKQSDR